MPIVPNLSAHRPLARRTPPAEAASFVAWPYVDSLYDFTKVLGQPLAILPSSAHGKRVAVVGAGPGGICAALELLRMGIAPTIYEGSGRIGGRNWTQPFDDGSAIAELGAMRVPPENLVFQYYAKLVGLTPTEFPDPGKVPTTLFYENTVYHWQAGDPPPGPFGPLQKEFNHFVDPLLAKLWAPWMVGDLAGVRKVWQEYVDEYSTKSWYEGVLQGTGWNQEQMNAFGALGLGSGGFGPLYDISFLDIFRLLANQLETNQQLYAQGISTLTNGMYSLPIQNAQGETVSLTGADALYHAYVTSLAQDGNGGWTIGDSNGRQSHYDAVVVATTTREMEALGLVLPSSPLQQDVQVAIRNLHMTESSKLFIKTATKFWKAPGSSLPWNIQTDQLPRGIYCLDYPQTDFGVVLISYTWGDDSAKLMAYDPQDRFELLKSVIATIDPTFAGYLVPVDGQILNVDWQLEPHYNGAFKLNLPGQEANVQSAYYQFLTAGTPNDAGLYLAGDGVSWTGGWTEGALQTGLNAAAAVGVHLGGTPIPLGPMTQRPLYVYPPATGNGGGLTATPTMTVDAPPTPTVT